MGSRDDYHSPSRWSQDHQCVSFRPGKKLKVQPLHCVDKVVKVRGFRWLV